MKKIFQKLTYIGLLLISFGSALYLLFYTYEQYRIKQETTQLKNFAIENHSVVQEDTIDVPIEEPIPEKTERMLKLESLQKENPDIVAWIEIENTNIHYPVLQGSDNDFYMNHNYKKQFSIAGSIFLDKNYAWNPPNSNLLLYGHNMKNGTMFQNLLKYQKKSFYDEHPMIRFTTLQDDGYFEIFSVFKSKVYTTSDQNVFRYYYFLNAQTQEQYDEFVENSKKASLYDTGKTAQYGEQLLTLSTCAYHIKDGRFVVVAKKM